MRLRSSTGSDRALAAKYDALAEDIATRD